MSAEQTNYDEVAEAYLSATDEKPFTKYYERPFIIDNLPSLVGKSILDVGCATGFYSKYCLQNGATVISVDASAKMVEHTVELCNGKNTGFVHDIAEPFDFVKSGSIDVIICSLVLHYVADWTQTLSEFSRILKMGGKCLISTHHPITDFTHFNSDSYHSKRLVEDEWQGFDPPIKVRYWVRPLNEYIQPMIDSKMTLVSVNEPGPKKDLESIDPRMHARLSTRPAFLFFVLKKS